MTKISVIVPTYNRAAYLGEAIQSVLGQSFKDFELIVTDDGSTDNTKEVVASFKDARIRYIRQENRGVAAARNTGIKASCGQYIAFLDSDDIWLSDNLKLKVQLLDSRPDIGLVCSDSYVFDDSTGENIGRVWVRPKKSRSQFDPVKAARQPLKELLYNGCFIQAPAAIMRRQVFDTIGYFDESLPTSEDWDMIIRILQCFSIATIGIPLVKIRRHNTNLTANREKVYRGAVSAINKVINSGSFSGVELKLIKERILPQHIRYGRYALHRGKEVAARKAMIAAVRLNPWNIKLYVYFILSFLKTRKIMALRNTRTNLRRRLASRQPSEGTSPVSS